MAKRRFRWSRELQTLVEVGENDEQPARNGDHYLWGDRGYENLRTTDGVDISTRTKHREYMRTHGLGTLDDFKDTFARAERQRDEYRTTGKGGATRKEDVARAFNQLERKR